MFKEKCPDVKSIEYINKMVMRAGKNHGELSYIKRHEIESWQSIKLFLGLAGVSCLVYLLYIIVK